MLNEKLKTLDDKIKNLKYIPTLRDGNVESSAAERICLLIESYRQAYGKIWKQHELINDCFGFSILAVMINAFTNYAVTYYVSLVDESKYVTTDFIVHPTVHTFHITILLVVLIRTCETSDELVSEIKHTPREIRVSARFFQAQNVGRHLNQLSRCVSYPQIKKFTLQINHHQRFVYNAHHYFDINMKLLFSVNRFQLKVKLTSSCRL